MAITNAAAGDRNRKKNQSNERLQGIHRRLLSARKNESVLDLAASGLRFTFLFSALRF
jgi:hypothetical protein